MPPLTRDQILSAALQKGVATVRSTDLARLAQVNQSTAWKWLQGLPVSEASERRIRQALGLCTEPHAA